MNFSTPTIKFPSINRTKTIFYTFLIATCMVVGWAAINAGIRATFHLLDVKSQQWQAYRHLDTVQIVYKERLVEDKATCSDQVNDAIKSQMGK